MSTVNSFNSRSTLTVGGTDYEVFRVDSVPGYEKLPFSLKVLLENLLRTEDGANVTKAQIEALGSWVPDGRARHRDPVHPGPRHHAGLHRRALHRRPRHDARGGQRARRRPEEDQPARARRARHRPLGHRRPLRHRGRLRAQRRDRVRAQRRALPVPALGPDRVRRLQGRAAGHRHRAPGQHRVPRPGHLHARGRGSARAPTPTPCVGTDSHTTMVNGLGVLGWGVGGIEAEAAMLGQPVSMLIPRVVGFKLSGVDPDRRDRDGCRAHHHRHAAQARRRRQVRRVLRRRRRARCRSPTARRSAT